MIAGKTTCLIDESTAIPDTTGFQEDGCILPNVGKSPFDGDGFDEIIASPEDLWNFPKVEVCLYLLQRFLVNYFKCTTGLYKVKGASTSNNRAKGPKGNSPLLGTFAQANIQVPRVHRDNRPIYSGLEHNGHIGTLYPSHRFCQNVPISLKSYQRYWAHLENQRKNGE